MRTNGHGKPVIACDIDGTLGDYHGHFLRFAEGWFGQEFPPPEEVNPGLKLWEFMEVPQDLYRRCKLAYRQGGMKRTMPVDPYAKGFSYDIHERNGELWLCTTRPHMRLDNIDEDTLEWLRRAGIVYDAVLFDRIEQKYSKYEELHRQASDRVVAIVDDLPELIEVAVDLFPSALVMVRDQPYNKQVEADYVQDWGAFRGGKIIRVGGCLEMMIGAAWAIQQWHIERGSWYGE